METVEQKISADVRDGARRARRKFFWLAAGVTLLFSPPLYELVRLSLKSELHSHLLLIPVVSWYVWRFLDGKNSEPGGNPPAGPAKITTGAIMAEMLGIAALALHYYLQRTKSWPVTEYLWAGGLGYLLVLLGVALRTVGWAKLKQHQFAIWFLAFFIPLPLAVTDRLSVALQLGSAEVTDWLFQLSGLPVMREDLVFFLPRLAIRVAEECSGVRSTLVLFITSLIAGKMFLQTGWRRAALALLTIPLGLLRNAARITVLGWLSVNVNENVIHGPLHHRGGPIFFALSLVPLFGLLWYFRRSESSKSAVKNSTREDG